MSVDPLEPKGDGAVDYQDTDTSRWDEPSLYPRGLPGDGGLHPVDGDDSLDTFGDCNDV